MVKMLSMQRRKQLMDLSAKRHRQGWLISLIDGVVRIVTRNKYCVVKVNTLRRINWDGNLK